MKCTWCEKFATIQPCMVPSLQGGHMSTSPSYARLITNFFPFYPVSQFQRKPLGFSFQKLQLPSTMLKRSWASCWPPSPNKKSNWCHFTASQWYIKKKRNATGWLNGKLEPIHLCCKAIPNTSTNWPRDPCVWKYHLQPAELGIIAQHVIVAYVKMQFHTPWSSIWYLNIARKIYNTSPTSLPSSPLAWIILERQPSYQFNNGYQPVTHTCLSFWAWFLLPPTEWRRISQLLYVGVSKKLNWHAPSEVLSGTSMNFLGQLIRPVFHCGRACLQLYSPCSPTHSSSRMLLCCILHIPYIYWILPPSNSVC